MGEYSKERKFFLKLPKEFFNSYWVKILEGMPNGQSYLLMYMKLMCESISYGGYLRFSEEIPYTPEMIASVTNTNLDTVRSGLDALGKLGLIKQTSDNTLLLPKVEEMTESTTRGAERMASYRKRLDGKGSGVTNVAPSVTPLYGNCSTDIDIELEDRSKSKSKNIELDTRSNILDSKQELDNSEAKDRLGKGKDEINEINDIYERCSELNEGKRWIDRYTVRDGKLISNREIMEELENGKN